MAQTALVDMQIKDGQLLLDGLARDGVPVKAAAWIRETESGDWYLYLVTPLVRKDGATRPAYHEVNRVIREMQKNGIWIEVEKKVVSPDESVGRALVALGNGPPGRRPRWFQGPRLGDLNVEEGYIYPAESCEAEPTG